ncbi:serine protease [Candidatus Uhrbacteria bacterium]|nr:serine protease [Candidatus Uhrbacteria bacterium]
MKSTEKILVTVGVSSVILGLIGGAVAGAVSANLLISPRIDRLADLVSAGATSTKPVEPPVVIVPLESRPIVASYPQAFLDRNASSLLRVVRRVRGASEDAQLAPERILGNAAALTSDGWVLVPDSVVSNVRIADLGIVWRGRVAAVEKGVRDTSTGLVYLKFAATDLPAVTFVRASDIASGVAVWVEQAPGALVPELIADQAVHASVLVSSERAARRFQLTSSGYPAGSAVWDSAGRLIGSIESKDSALVIPAGVSGPTLSSIISENTISRASLGLRTLDLSDLVFENPSSSLPRIGAWVRSKTTSASREILEGDVIERIERDILDGNADLGERLLDYRPGSSVTLTVRRKGESIQIKTQLGSASVAETLK